MKIVSWISLVAAAGLGFSVCARADSLISTNTAWSYFRGVSEASQPDSTAWRRSAFNDAAWPSARAPFYYENNPGTAGAFSGNTALTDMFGGYTCVFFRRPFVVTNVADVGSLQLRALAADGFIAWVNGVEVGRFNVAAGEIPFTGNANAPLSRPVAAQTVVIATSSFLVPGTNLLAVQALDSGLGLSSGFLFDASLDSTPDTNTPVVAGVLPRPGALVDQLNQIEVFFSRDVAGVDAADLLINGSPATNVTAYSAAQYVFDFPAPPTGAVHIAWSAGAGITDLSSQSHPFAGGSWDYTLSPLAYAQSPVISEFMASNKNTLNDEDGNSSDWIEIYNPSASSVNLKGWSLTDTPTNLTRWRFPGYVMPGQSYIVVFASGKNRTNVTGILHTDFALSKSGQYLALVNPATNVVSDFGTSYPAQAQDVSYGRDRQFPSYVGFYSTPTPGKPNAGTGSAFGPDVLFSVGSGTFTSGFSLMLTSGDTNVLVHYTFGTNYPTPSSPIYTGPIPVTNTLQVRARTFVAGRLPGNLRSEDYVFLAPNAAPAYGVSNLATFSSDLPIIVFHNYGGGPVPASLDQFCILQSFEPKLGRASLANPPDLSTKAHFHLRGSSTLSYPKGSFALQVDDEYQDGVKVPLLGLPTESDWVLYAPNNFDPGLIHNPLSHELNHQLGEYSSRYQFVEVFLKAATGAPGPITPADYNGIYVLEEKIKLSKNRVNITPLGPTDNTPQLITGGYLVSVDRQVPGGAIFTTAASTLVGPQTLNYLDPKGAEIVLPQSVPQELYLSNYFGSYVQSLNSSNFTDPVSGYAAWLDVPAAIDHHVHNVIVFNVDGLRLSGYLHKPRDGKITFGPNWDFDRTQGSTDGRDFNPRVWQSTVPDFGTDFFNYPWWERMFHDPDFWQKWIDRYQELRGTVYANANVAATIDMLANQVKAAQPREYARWSGSAPLRSGIASAGGFSYNFGSGGYAAEIQWEKNWYSNRLDFADSQFVPPPTLSHAGGPADPGLVISVGGPANKVYYTLDGSDPRAPGGGIAPGALLYTGGVGITNNARLVARVRDLSHVQLTGAHNPPLSSPWSGPVSATFVVSTPALRITEIMYHPSGPAAGDTNIASNFQFVEVQNVGPTSIDLNRAQIGGDVQFTFPSLVIGPGQTVVVVANTNSFALRYGGASGAVVAGQFSGRLLNSGGHLTLAGPFLEPILDFTFDDKWYPLTDGLGFSLVIVDSSAPADTWSTRESWRTSSEVNGSPGKSDPPSTLSPVLVNELLPHPTLLQRAAVELFNPTDHAVNISGWFLTDAIASPKKYRFPTGSIVPSQGFFLITDAQFGAGTNPVVFSPYGGQVYLFSADTSSNLTGFAHGFDYTAQAAGDTAGRYAVDGMQERFVTQAAPSLGGANVGPRVGPVVISEILYHPQDIVVGSTRFDNVRDEFIELQNITSAPVPLYDPAYPTNAWRLQNTVSFQFPPGAALPAGGFAIVVPFSPTNAAALALFQSLHPVPAGVALYGPWIGQLSNTLASVDLVRPDAPSLPPAADAGYVPLLLIERVTYQGGLPWPVAANGVGLSLHRVVATSFGDVSTNWAAAPPNPGTGYSGGAAPRIFAQPQSVTAIGNTTPLFSVQAAGAGAIAYQWLFNGVPLAGATNSVLFLPTVQTNQAGVYQVVVFNAAGAVASATATLTVIAPVYIVQQPATVSARVGSNATFTVGAVSSGSISYQWRNGGLPIPGATNNTYTIANVQPSDNGVYSVFVSDPISSTLSSNATLYVLVNPIIVQQPLSQEVVAGGSVVVSVVVSNTVTLPIGYRWRKSGVTTMFQTLPSLTSYLIATNLQASVTFTVVVTNLANPNGILSSNAVITVLPDTDHDGLPDAWEIANGFNPNDPNDGALDADGDGMTNYEEYIAGTDPRDPLSYLEVVAPTRDEVAISFLARTNRTYTIEYSDTLAAGSWQRLADVPGRNSNRVERVVDPNPGSHRTYRLTVPYKP